MKPAPESTTLIDELPTTQTTDCKSDDTPKGTFCFVSLGCPKNTVDSERMLGLLAEDGYIPVPDPDGADLVVVNTCGFIEASRAESMSVINEMLERKRLGQVRGVIVAGCLAERQKDLLLDEVPEVDQVIGVFSREEIVKAADRVVGGLEEQRSVFNPAPVRALDDTARLRITPRHLAYLKVSEGCSRFCTFCSIPYMRGKHLTKPIEAVVAEARELAADGVLELNLVAQDMTYYGVDLYGRPRLAELIRELNQVDGIKWIRILYNYPSYFTDDLYEALVESEKVIPYLDMPLQHINDRMLKVMNRRHTREETEVIINRLRDSIPGLVLRTTLIVGFPGETDSEFQELLSFVKEARFERLGVFTYSLEPDTPAAKLPGHLPEELKQERQGAIMAAQQPIAFEFNRSLVGQTLDVLIDGQAPPKLGPGVRVGRTYADAPDVDGLVQVRNRSLRPGDLIPCTIIETDGYDLIARPLEGAIPRRPAKPKPRPRPRKAGTTSPFTILPD